MRKHSLFSLVAGIVMGMVAVGISSTETALATSTNNNAWCELRNNSRFNIPERSSCSPATDSSNQSITPKAVATQHPHTNNSGLYVALGDSVAAGFGLPLSPEATPTDTQCGRSSEAYPAIVATDLRLPLINASCSGATVGDLSTKQAMKDGPDIPAQLDTAFSGGTPALITITAGANDAHWADFISACYTFDCTGSEYDHIARAYMTALRVKLEYAFASIHARSRGTPPKVIITGYYNPLSSACASQQSTLTVNELAWLNGQLDTLNQTILTASRYYSFVKFVPIDFAGHDICSEQPWIQGFQDAAPFHPTAMGQQVIAAAVLSAARN